VTMSEARDCLGAGTPVAPLADMSPSDVGPGPWQVCALISWHLRGRSCTHEILDLAEPVAGVSGQGLHNYRICQVLA
jgi:hypothetical protein